MQEEQDTIKDGEKTMKLLICPRCSDIFNLQVGVKRSCHCGKSSGLYTDNQNATLYGDAIPIGFDNRSFVSALKKRPEYGQGKEFSAFIIPKRCPTISYDEEKKEPLPLTGKKK